MLPIFARLSEFTFVNPKINGVDSYIDYLYHANNLYKYPQQIILIVFLKSREKNNKSFCPTESDYYTEPKPDVNLYF